jgi:exonuclease VII small subunit
MWRLLRTMSNVLLIDKVVKRVKDVANVDPSLDEALEQYEKAQAKIDRLEQVIARKHKRLQSIVIRNKQS